MNKLPVILLAIVTSSLFLSGCSDSDKFTVMDSVVLGETNIQTIRDLAEEKKLSHLFRTVSKEGLPLLAGKELFVKGDIFNNPNEYYSRYQTAKNGDEIVIAELKAKEVNDLIFSHYLESLKKKYGNYTSLSSYSDESTTYTWSLEKLRVNLSFSPYDKTISVFWAMLYTE